MKCSTDKPTTEFHRRGKSFQSECKPCKASRDVAIYKQNRSKIISQKKARRLELSEKYLDLKRGKPCKDCKEIFHPVAMQWDHLPGMKKIANVADLKSSNTWKKLKKEIEKCELVCANCHAVRTYKRLLGV